MKLYPSAAVGIVTARVLHDDGPIQLDQVLPLNRNQRLRTLVAWKAQSGWLSQSFSIGSVRNEVSSSLKFCKSLKYNFQNNSDRKALHMLNFISG